ncbi:ankyrin repeat-containing domain protein [Mycena albidolilacea]|uniref:Ankyrin repeat-containing domain protein n=1 Tax=Mycena albidolilacea TaxID=1033008 RepID=A0AAD7F287_9AGAR|nr:ankyrin repeat-containing domain protein [Mycena albidolilacea]
MQFCDLPAELVLHTVSLITRPFIDPDEWDPPFVPELVPDVPSINSLSQTNTVFHQTLNKTLYRLCAKDAALRKRALVFAITHELETTLDKLVAEKLSLDGEFEHSCYRGSLLHIAAGMGLRTMVAKLLDLYGGGMMARVHARNKDNRTPLDDAVFFGHMDVVQLLAPIRPPPATPPPPILLNKDYLSPALLQAAASNRTEMAVYLISEGADVNILDDKFYSRTPLYYPSFTKNLRLVQILLAAGANPNLHKRDAFIPLFTAVRSKNLPIVQALVDGGADIHVRDRWDRNVLFHQMSIELFRFFLERGVDPNQRDYAGSTALHKVCGSEHAEYEKGSVELLCEFGALPDKPDDDGKTAVGLAMENRLSDIVKILEPFVQNPDLQAKIAEWSLIKVYSTSNLKRKR